MSARFVIPAKAGIQGFPANARCALVSKALDPRLRGDDGPDDIKAR